MSTSENSAENDDLNDPQRFVVHRPPFQLRSLPIEYRWEVTRRHPYYQMWWEQGRDFYQKKPLSHPAEVLARQVAMIILGAIGVSAEPPDPATEFSQFDEDGLKDAWMSGAVHPITLRGIVGLLLTTLPKESCAYVGMQLLEVACDDVEGEPPRLIGALSSLYSSNKPGLDSYPDEPFVSINPAVAGRDITRAINTLLKDWKSERSLGESRDRSHKYPDYLRVWDLREGWVAGAYDRQREQKLREIAAELKMSIKTAQNHYTSAFEMIVGQRYTPELWCRLMGPLKIAELFGDVPGSVSRHRPLSSRTTRDVPESVVSPAAEEGHMEGLVNACGAGLDGGELKDLVSEILRLVESGLSDKEIVEEMDASNELMPAIAYLRNRQDDVAALLEN